MSNIFDKISPENLEFQSIEKEDPEFDSPHGSRWIVGIDDNGTVYVLSRPHIHDSFFECGGSAEDIGLPESAELPPGVYEWICDFSEYKDWESGYVDYWEFAPRKSTLLFSWDNGEINKS